MKKLLISAIALLGVSNAFGGLFGGGCNGCRRVRSCPETSVTCEAKPVCYKMVRKECPARKVCETTCHFVCPPDTIREEGQGED
jgi:hypothetical protein